MYIYGSFKYVVIIDIVLFTALCYYFLVWRNQTYAWMCIVGCAWLFSRIWVLFFSQVSGTNEATRSKKKKRKVSVYLMHLKFVFTGWDA